VDRKIKAHLSHRRNDGKLSDFAQFLLDCTPEDIELKVDCRDAELSLPIDEFIGELKTSSSVVFLLNDGFFRSPWCMGELYAFLERRVVRRLILSDVQKSRQGMPIISVIFPCFHRVTTLSIDTP